MDKHLYFLAAELYPRSEKIHCLELYSQGNSVVHSLSVILSNHTILLAAPYNEPCPEDQLSWCNRNMACRKPSCRG